MKVVINRKYGGFGLSDRAVQTLIALGMTVCDADEDDNNKVDFVHTNKGLCGYWCARNYDKAFRCDPRVVQVVEEMGSEANGPSAALRVVDIPFDTTEGWDIGDHDGMERIEESHEICRDD